MTTYAAIFDRFASCTRDGPLLPSETTGGRLVLSELVTVLLTRRILHRRPSHLTPGAPHAGAGGARSLAISDRISWNICRDTATSAIWKVT